MSTWRSGLFALSLAWPFAAVAGSAEIHLLTEEFPPFNMASPDGRVGGLSTELIRELLRRAGVPYQIHIQPWIRAYNTALLQDNTCGYSTSRTESREHQFKWVGPLVDS